MLHPDDRANDRYQASRWAYELTKRQTWCILDTETTGPGNQDQICQIAVTDCQGLELFNSLVRPTIPISPDATAIHGITNETVEPFDNFAQIFMELWAAIGDREIIIYNSEFDLRMIRQSLAAWRIPLVLQSREFCPVPEMASSWHPYWLNGAPVQCAMSWFSQWCGEWNDYHGNYRWQRLPGGDHTALGDCLATLAVIRRMADSFKAEGAGLKPMPAPETSESDGARLVEMPPIATAAELSNDYDDIPF